MKIQSSKAYGVDRLKILIYGPSGNGKTTFLGSSGEKTLIISAEAGLLALNHTKEIYGDWIVEPDFIDISLNADGTNIPEHERIFGLKKIYEYLQKPEAREKYSYICVDSLSEISELLVAALKHKYPNKKDSMNVWDEYTTELRSIIKSYRDLPHFHVVMSALSKEGKDDDGQVLTLPDVNGKVMPQKLPAYFDEVFYLHKEKKDDVFVRKILTSGTDTIRAKDRSGKLDRLEEPNLRDIANKIKGQKS